MNNEIDCKEQYETQCERIRQLEKDNQELCNIIRENEENYTTQKNSMQISLNISFIIGGIIAYLLFGQSTEEILERILFGFVYSFSTFMIGNILFICIKDLKRKK